MLPLKIYRNDIQALRGVAVLGVVLYHSDGLFFSQGFLGVDVFFVISGFVVTPLIIRIFDIALIDKNVLSNLKTFYINRFYRLAPALIATLFFSIFLIFIFGPIGGHYRFAMQGIATLFLAGNMGAYIFKGDYFSPYVNPLSHTWSLSVEEQIYIYLPALLLIFLRKRKDPKKIIKAVFWVVGIISFLSFLFSDSMQSIYGILGINSPSQFSFYSPIDRFWQFSVGGILFITNKNFTNVKNRKLKFFSVALFPILLICLFGQLNLNSKIGVIGITILTVLVIGLKSLDLVPDIVKKFLAWFGDRSYSIYLLHFPIIYLARYSPVFELNVFEHRKLQTLFAILLTIILANFSYSKIENRFRKTSHGVSTHKISKKQIIASLIISLLLLTSISLSGSKKILADPKSPISSGIDPQDWDINCKFHQPSLPPRNSPCLYGTNTFQKNFLLIGDSHAGHLSKTFIEIGKENGANVYVYTHSACPFLLTPKVLENKRLFPLFTKECLDHNFKIVKFLNEVKIDTVFYTQRSVVPYIAPITIENLSKLNSLIYLSLIQIKDLANNLLFIGITPEYAPVDTVLFKLLGHEGVYLDTPAVDNEVWKKKLISSSIKYVDVYSKFCSELNICRNQLGGKWLFVDNDHLSQSGGVLIKLNINKELLVIK